MVEIGTVTQAVEVTCIQLVVHVVADGNEGSHLLWTGCTMFLMDHMVVRVVGLLEAVRGEASLKEEDEEGTKTKITLVCQTSFADRKFKCYFSCVVSTSY